MTSEVARLVVAADSELGRAIADMRAMQREMQAMSAGANAMAGHTGAAANAMKSAFTTAAQVGTVAALALGAGLAAAGGAALKLGTDFESAGNQFAAVANISKASDEFRQFQETARAMGADLDLPATSARSAALAMVEMKKAGMENAAVFGEVKGVLQLGAAAMIDEARAAQIVTGAMNAFKAEALSATQVADMFANAANASAASMTDVSQGFAQASAAFAQANQSALHLTTGIAALANVNISGSDAGTALKNAITRLIAPTDEARAVMQQLGINVFDAQGNMLGLPAIIDQFNAALAPLTQEAQGAVLQTILLSDGMKAMGPLLDLGSAGFNALAQQIGQQGAAASLAQAQMQGLQGAVGGLSSQVETAATDLATPFLEPLAQIVSQVAAKVPEIAAQFQPLAGQIASNIVPAFDSVVATFSTVASAVSPLLGALMSLFNMFSAASNGTITFQTALSSISPALSPLGSMIDTARAAIGALTAGLPPLSSILTTVAAVAGGVFVGALLALQAGLLGIGAVVNFVVGNWQTFAVIAGVAAGALAGYAAATAYAAAATLAASITAAGGLTMWAGKAVMTWVTSQMAAAGITSAWLAAALPFVVVGAAIAAFAVAYATNAFGVRDTTLQVVEQIKAGWSNLVANVSAIGEFLRQPVTNIGEAWGTLQSTMAANNAAYQAQLDTIATGTAATRGMVGVEVDAMAVQHGTAMGSMMESTSVASQAIQAIMRGDFGALPGIVGGNMEALKGMFGGKLGDMIAQAAEAAAQIRAQLASVTGVVGAGATGAAAVDEFRKERFNAQAAEAKATAAAAANAGKATGAAVKAFGSNALPATSGAAKAIKSVDEQVRDAAQAIAAVSDTVAKLKEFLSGGKLEGLDAGDTAGKIIAIAQNLTNMGRAFADQFAAAGKGLTENALKAAQQLAEGVSSSTGALGNTVGYLQKLHEFMTSPAWAIMSDTAVVVEVSGQLSQMGRAIFDAFSGAAVGLEQGAADASKVLAEGIGAASSGLSSLVGLLPKLWEFMNDPAFGEIMNAQGRIVAAAAQLSALGRSIFEGFARASAGIGEDAVAGAKVLSEGVGAATSALTATLDFVAKLVVALGDVDIVAAIGTSEGRARMVAASAQLTQLARAIFVNFAAASQGIETVTVTAAKGFAEAVTAVVGALGGVLDFIGKLVTALGDVDARAALETDAGRTMVVHFGFVLASLGRLLLLNFSQVGADVGSVAVAAAKRFGEGVQAAVGALGAALDFVVKLVAAVGDTSVQAALMSQAGASRIVHFGHTLSSLGRALLLNFVAASAGLGSLATAAAKRFGEGVQAAVGALGGVLDFTHKLLTALGDTSLRAALLADEGRGRIIHFAHTLSGLARAFLLNFAAAGTGLGSDTTTAAKLLADGVQAAVGALGGVLDVTQKILAAVADVGLRSALLDADALGGIRHFAFVLGNLGRAILTNFAAASTIGSDTLTAAKVLADGIGAATSGLGAVLDIVPRLLDVVTRQQPMLAALMTHSDGVKGLGSWLAIWGRELVRVFASAAASLSSVEAAGAKPLTDAVGGVADALSSLLGVLPQLLEVVLRQSGMLAALMANSDGVKGLALWFAVWR
jgi:TP901 family phage tail tape measure protein